MAEANPPASAAAAPDPAPDAAPVPELFSPEFIADPLPTYRHLLAERPFFQVPGTDMWVLAPYAACQAVLKDRRFGHDFQRRMREQLGERVFADNPAYALLANSMLQMDPPDHKRVRTLAVKAFSAGRIEALRPRIRALANELIDAFIADGAADLVRQFNHPLPVMVICELLGVPREDWSRFTDDTRIGGRLIDPTPMTEAELAEVNANVEDAKAYWRALCDRRRAEPRDDLITALVQAETEDGTLTQDELAANIQLLFGAGHETTVNLLGNGLLALHHHPEQWAALRDHPELTPSAVEEMLRFDSSVQLSGRTALEDAEVMGQPVPAGASVVTLLGAANHDPAAFAQPERFEIRRDGPKPLSFGGGIHFCLGAQLARVEADEALRLLFARLPGLALVDVEPPARKPTITLRGVTALPARWSAPAA